ncbi:hypothetical protein [Actinoplanes couchii]|uniref:hypothetical protein n=1 Tax=Actinoplanes couchii TaxID=403638 RepID=UPI00286AD4B4|nr:hypothetical protein [Actinoplanes couchii]
MSRNGMVREGCGFRSRRFPEVVLFDQAPTSRTFVQVAGVASLVFIGAAVLALSLSPAGFFGMAVYALLPVAWLTTFSSLAGLALASIRY